MAFCQRAHGALNFKIGNISYDITEADVTIQPVPYTFNEKPNGHVSVENTSVKVTATFQVPDGVSVKDILTTCGDVITVQEWNGRTWVFRNAKPTFSGDPWNVTQGELQITWVAEVADEIFAA